MYTDPGKFRMTRRTQTNPLRPTLNKHGTRKLAVPRFEHSSVTRHARFLNGNSNSLARRGKRKRETCENASASVISLLNDSLCR